MNAYLVTEETKPKQLAILLATLTKFGVKAFINLLVEPNPNDAQIYIARINPSSLTFHEKQAYKNKELMEKMTMTIGKVLKITSKLGNRKRAETFERKNWAFDMAEKVQEFESQLANIQIDQ